MTDRELLELAAKAVNKGAWHPLTHEKPWNPLTDDGDALRLAVTLRMTVQVREAVTFVTDTQGRQLAHRAHKPHGYNPYAATRRAIVRAAAEIGRTIP